MLTKTLPQKEKSTETINSPEFIEKQVDERGFYLYEWISADELRMSVLSDYLGIIKASSMPLAIITLIFWFLWLTGWVFGVIVAVLWVLGVFYSIVLCILILKMIKKSYLYTRWANVVITDNNYVSAGKVVERSDFRAQKDAFYALEKTFREPLLEPSWLSEHIAEQREWLIDQLKWIAGGWGKIIENMWRSRDSQWIVLVIMIAGVLYGGMMAIVYFLWVFFVAFLARIFSWISHKALLISNNTEHEIQTLFSNIYKSSLELKSGKKQSVSLLTEASQNAWADNLSGKIQESFELIGEMAKNATEDTLRLRNLLESSKYKDIFNFVKYGNWIKMQVIEPINEIHQLLEKNRDILEKTVVEIDKQISDTDDTILQKPLILQKERLLLQKESIERVIYMLEWYQEKLAS